jgi:hypothetical protein
MQYITQQDFEGMQRPIESALGFCRWWSPRLNLLSPDLPASEVQCKREATHAEPHAVNFYRGDDLVYATWESSETSPPPEVPYG